MLQQAPVYWRDRAVPVSLPISNGDVFRSCTFWCLEWLRRFQPNNCKHLMPKTTIYDITTNHFTLWYCDNAWKIWLVLPDQWCTSSGLEFERKAIFIELGVYSTSKPAINRSACISNTLNQLLSLIIRLLFLFLSPIIVDLIYVLCINWGYCLILEKSFTFFWLSK